jgi:hypothetical protein
MALDAVAGGRFLQKPSIHHTTALRQKQQGRWCSKAPIVRGKAYPAGIKMAVGASLQVTEAPSAPPSTGRRLVFAVDGTQEAEEALQWLVSNIVQKGEGRGLGLRLPFMARTD